MVCNICLRSVILQAAHVRKLSKGGLHFSKFKRTFITTQSRTNIWNWKITSTRKMMVDSSGTTEGSSAMDVSTEKEDNGGYVTGGWKSEDGKMSCGYSSFRGKRANMEDFYDIKTSKIDGKTVCLFGIFDGHGGSRAAEFLKEHLFENLMKHPKFVTDTKLAINVHRWHKPQIMDIIEGGNTNIEREVNLVNSYSRLVKPFEVGETYQQTDMKFLESEKDTFRDDGSTASTAVLVGNHLYVANVGDSRTVVSKAGRAIPLSDDHKPNRSDERKRIENAGGVVMWAGTWRVGGVLAMSRAFGNRMLKQFVVADPEIQEQEIDKDFELLVLASDGLWDVVPNEDAMSLASSEEQPEAAARKLTETAFTRGSADNITCIVVKFCHDEADLDKPKANVEPNPKSAPSDPKPDASKAQDPDKGGSNKAPGTKPANEAELRRD